MKKHKKNTRKGNTQEDRNTGIHEYNGSYSYNEKIQEKYKKREYTGIQEYSNTRIQEYTGINFNLI